MFTCKICGKTVPMRTEFLLHMTVCKSFSPLDSHEKEADDASSNCSSPIDDSDADPCWSPAGCSNYNDNISYAGSESSYECSSFTQEQINDSLNNQDIFGQELNKNEIANIDQSSSLTFKKNAITHNEQDLSVSSSLACNTSNVKDKITLVKKKIDMWTKERKMAISRGQKSKARRLLKIISKNKDSLGDESMIAEHDPHLESQISKDANSTKRKRNYCKYCDSLVAKFAEHLEKKHKNTPEGLNLINLNLTVSDSKIRKKLKTEATNDIRKTWNSMYNQKVISINETSLTTNIIPVKRGSFKALVECDLCKGVYRRDSLRKHIKICLKNKNLTYSGPNQAIKQYSSTIINNDFEITSQFKNEILKGINIDSIMQVALKDSLIMKFGSKFHISRRETSGKNYVIREIRDLALLLIKIQMSNPEIKTLQDCLTPSCFPEVLKASLALAGYCPETGDVKVPSIAYRLTHPIKEAVNLLKEEKIIKIDQEGSRDRTEITKLEDFLDLMKNQWKVEIGRISSKAVKRNRAVREEKMALEEDIIKVASYIEKSYKRICGRVEGDSEKCKWYDNLMHMLVSHIMLLIRRRPVDFKHAKTIHFSLLDKHDDLIEMIRGKSNDLTEEDLASCRNFHLFYVPGKNLELVPMVMTPTMKLAMVTLIRYRSDVNITSDKLFVLSNDTDIRPDVSLKIICKNVHLKKPNDLTCNGLRHQAATFSRLHSTHPQYQDYLASALGHTLSVHKKHYELPLGVIQKLMVCPVLHKIMIGKGTANSSVSSNFVDSDNNKHSSEIQQNTNCQQQVSQTTPVKRPASSEDDDSSDVELKKKKKKWSREEQDLVFSQFGEAILNKTVPKRSEVVCFFKKFGEKLPDRSIDQVVLFVRNHATRKQLEVTPKIKRFLKSKREGKLNKTNLFK